MPTLTRLVLTLAGIGGILYGAAYWLAETVEPNQTEIIIPLPNTQLQPQKAQ